MASEYPDSRFVGTDVAATFPSDIHPRNVKFLRADTTKGLPFPDKSFDFVYQRSMTLAYTLDQWEFVIDELIRVTKPGGWIQLGEYWLTHLCSLSLILSFTNIVSLPTNLQSSLICVSTPVAHNSRTGMKPVSHLIYQCLLYGMPLRSCRSLSPFLSFLSFLSSPPCHAFSEHRWQYWYPSLLSPPISWPASSLDKQRNISVRLGQRYGCE